MNKSELIKAVADATETKVVDTGRIVEAVFDTITRSLKKGDQVAVAGFGTFVPKARKAREGRNPSTGAVIQIPAKTTAAFKPAAALKDL
ncbi:MAG: HU family DNA-binding protein [Hyphomonadaceae bacterium]